MSSENKLACGRVSGMLAQVLSFDNLESAWEHVRIKHGGPGLDRETVEDIERDAVGVLGAIRQQVLEDRYRPGNLLAFEKAKSSGGTREITVCNLRDRILARAISQVLVQRFNGVLLPQCYAYRPHRGAIKAVTAIQQACKKAAYAVRADFEQFFDRMDHTRLADCLTALGVPEELLSLILRFVKAARFDGSATYTPHLGVPQGSPLSPVLANLYLNEFDHRLQETHPRFVRYADDVVVLTEDITSAQQALQRMQELAAECALSLSTAKTRVMRIDEGFLFLGFVFNREGHCASREARERLEEKLGEAPRDDEWPEETQQRKAAIVRGWENYFGEGGGKSGEDCAAEEQDQGAEPAGSMPVRAAPGVEVRAATCPEAAERLQALRRELASGDISPGEPAYTERLVELASEYEATGLMGAARACMTEAGVEAASGNPEPAGILTSADVTECWLSRLCRTEMGWKKGTVDRLGRIRYVKQEAPLTRSDLEAHLLGQHTVSVPVFRNRELVWFGVVDLDITRKVVEALTPSERDKKLESLRREVIAMAQRCGDAGVQPLVEFSGYKGYHLWIHMDQPVPVQDMVTFLQELNRISGDPPPGTHRELFPASVRASEEGMQTHMKWIMGLHPLTRIQGYLLDRQGNALSAPALPPPGDLCSTLGELRDAVKRWTRYRPDEQPAGTDAPEGNSLGQRPQPASVPPGKMREAPAGDFDPERVLKILRQRCGVLDALCRKSEQEADLTHQERVVVRGILQPLGPERGRAAVHRVIRTCGNYDPERTDSFMKEDLQRPMACARIREILGTFCEKAGCNCHFRQLKKSYNHPLRHLRESATAAAGKCLRSEVKKASPRAAASHGEGISLEMLSAYHAARKQALEISQLLAEAVARNGNRCPLGKVVKGPADAELPVWRVEI